ncbi:MAG: hypothetical protein KDD11_16785 [Acidobacteria bacterium]|nr:hypothetical protein [Acidobacteriota bacterium]
MRNIHRLGLVLALFAGAMVSPAFAAGERGPAAPALEDQKVVVDGRVFASWEDYVKSDYFRTAGKRCGTPEPSTFFGLPEGSSGADCSFGSTNPDPIYDPGMTYQVPVVVHILENAAGTQGTVADSFVYSQIDVLNEDFQAIAGSLGAPGTDAAIHFVMADEDPLTGLQTSGITRSNNDTWYNDGGAYYNTLAWDTNNFMNIYTNQAGGNLGYVPDLPQGGLAGSDSDRVVILWTAFGRNSSLSPYDLGRTATHEVGHYMGLYHTFNSGCGTATTPGCYTTGDRICDTASESTPYFGCGSPRSTCGSVDPRENYMDYSDDICMNQFSAEQSRRIRCSIENYRSNLFSPIEPDQIFLDGFESGNTSAWDATGGSAAGTLLSVTNGAAIEGNDGLQATFTATDTDSDYVVDDTLGGLGRYRVRFWIDPTNLTMDTNKRFKILTLFSGTPDNYRLATLVLRYNGGDYFLRAKAHDDPASAGWNQIDWVQLDNAGPNLVEIDWKQSTSAGSPNGYLRLWLNSRPIGEATNINNDERSADFVRFGVVGGLDVNSVGSVYFDGFESRNSLYIGN